MTLVVTVPILIWTGFVARRAARAAEAQATAADAQVKAAHAATGLAEEQLKAALDSAAAEREHSALIKEQLLASLRPVLVFEWRLNGNLPTLFLRNQSPTAFAFEVVVSHRSREDRVPVFVSQSILGPAAEGIVQISTRQLQDGSLIAQYRSADYRTFITTAHPADQGGFTQSTEQTG